MNPCCTGSSSPSVSRPSTVRTSRPPAIAARTVHDLTGSLSIQTTQVPQLEVSQPPVRACQAQLVTQEVHEQQRGSTSSVTSVPFTVIETCISVPLSPNPGDCAAQGPLGQLVGQVQLVLHAAPHVSARTAAVRGDHTGLGIQLFGRNLVPQGL